MRSNTGETIITTFFSRVTFIFFLICKLAVGLNELSRRAGGASIIARLSWSNVSSITLAGTVAGPTMETEVIWRFAWRLYAGAMVQFRRHFSFWTLVEANRSLLLGPYPSIRTLGNGRQDPDSGKRQRCPEMQRWEPIRHRSVSEQTGAPS
jgi:hypothetical protein